jgi:hypothetical protein
MSLHQGPDAAPAKTSYDDSTLADHDTLPSEEKVDPNDTPAITTVDAPTDDFPDGGFRAWLVVFGVSKLLSLSIPGTDRFTTNFRLCATPSPREQLTSLSALSLLTPDPKSLDLAMSTRGV